MKSDRPLLCSQAVADNHISCSFYSLPNSPPSQDRGREPQAPQPRNLKNHRLPVARRARIGQGDVEEACGRGQAQARTTLPKLQVPAPSWREARLRGSHIILERGLRSESLCQLRRQVHHHAQHPFAAWLGIDARRNVSQDDRRSAWKPGYLPTPWPSRP